MSSFQTDNFGQRGSGVARANNYSAWIDRYTQAKAQGMTEDEAIAQANQPVVK